VPYAFDVIDSYGISRVVDGLGIAEA